MRSSFLGYPSISNLESESSGWMVVGSGTTGARASTFASSALSVRIAIHKQQQSALRAGSPSFLCHPAVYSQLRKFK